MNERLFSVAHKPPRGEAWIVGSLPQRLSLAAPLRRIWSMPESAQSPSRANSPGAPAARLFALIPSAGVGSRAGAAGPKQYVVVAGQSVVAHTLAAFAAVPRIHATLVVVSPDDEAFERAAPAFKGPGAWVERCGGSSRAHSVLNGLNALQTRGAQAHDWVLVHDAARCLVQPGWIDTLIDACQHDAVGGLLAMPLADTLKQAHQGRVSSTLERREKWAAQTPQMFRLGLLMQALHRALELESPSQDAGHGHDEPGNMLGNMSGRAPWGPLGNQSAEGPSQLPITDEASAIEAMGHAPLLVSASLENFKLTWPADFALAERLLATRPAP
jgi:2-C-methyl-D-erythritol 4-phosphate cytidylyltransferase